jgi:hypothetical protein
MREKVHPPLGVREAGEEWRRWRQRKEGGAGGVHEKGQGPGTAWGRALFLSPLQALPS